MLKFKVNDKVVVRSGKDKGREGTIQVIFPKEGKAIVEGINIYKKAIKKAVAADGKGGIYEIPRPIHLSKLTLVDAKSGKKTRVFFKMEGDKKVRYSQKTKKAIDIK